MNPLKRIRRFAAVLAGLAGARVAFGATPAFATLPPPDGPGVRTSHAGTITSPVEVHTVVVGGMLIGPLIMLVVVPALQTLILGSEREQTPEGHVAPAE